MALADLWNRTLVYFGIAEEEDDWEDDVYVTEEDVERTYSDRPNVRRLAPRRARAAEFDDWTESGETRRTTALRQERPRLRSVQDGPPAAPATGGNVRVHLVVPRGFNDAQHLADRFKDGVPVILNLQSSDAELSKRLIDFASGLTYALNGGMQRVADKVFLLTPQNVEVSAEERARLLDRDLF